MGTAKSYLCSGSCIYLCGFLAYLLRFCAWGRTGTQLLGSYWLRLLYHCPKVTKNKSWTIVEDEQINCGENYKSRWRANPHDFEVNIRSFMLVLNCSFFGEPCQAWLHLVCCTIHCPVLWNFIQNQRLFHFLGAFEFSPIFHDKIAERLLCSSLFSNRQTLPMSFLTFLAFVNADPFDITHVSAFAIIPAALGLLIMWIGVRNTFSWSYSRPRMYIFILIDW